MNCSIIIRSFNEERHIGRLLDGISKQKFLFQYEVILVDSGSTDATVFIAQNLGAKIISIKPEEFSFGRALNIGCRKASGDILLFASAHVYPIYPDWIEKMISPFNDDQIALVYGRQIGNELNYFSEHQIFAKWFPENSNYNQNHPFCNNANCAVRRSLWSGQPFDESLTGLEDLDWAQKIQKKGYRIAYEASATVVHVHEETPAKIRNRYQREAIALKNIIPSVKFTLFDFMKLFIANVTADLLRAIRIRIFFQEFQGILIFRYMQFLGTYRGHRQKGEISKELKDKFYYPRNINWRKREVKEHGGKKQIEY